MLTSTRIKTLYRTLETDRPQKLHLVLYQNYSTQGNIARQCPAGGERDQIKWHGPGISPACAEQGAYPGHPVSYFCMAFRRSSAV